MEEEAGGIPRTAEEEEGVRSPKAVRSGGGSAEEARPSDGRHDDVRCRPSAHGQSLEQRLPCQRMRLRP